MIDFSSLSDDQLAELVKAACMEAVKRNPAVEAAVRSVMLTEAEKLTITRQAAEREALRLRALEADRVAREAQERVRAEATGQTLAERTAEMAHRRELVKRVAAPVVEALGPGWHVTVETLDGRRQVQLRSCYEDSGSIARSSNYASTMTLRVNGDETHEPGSLTHSSAPPKYGSRAKYDRLRTWVALDKADKEPLKAHLHWLDETFVELSLYCDTLAGNFNEKENAK